MMWADQSIVESSSLNYSYASPDEANSKPRDLVTSRYPETAIQSSSSQSPSTRQGMLSTAPKKLDVSGMLEPAVDGPPSAERLRQLNTQMRQAPHLHRRPGHRTASSGSSSISTLHTNLENAMENIDLVRPLTNRSMSIDSGHSTWDVTDSFQTMSKNLFNRRGRSKRGTSSSGSSSYSTDLPANVTFANAKDSLMTTFFARRKSSRDEENQRKVQISGPFNFQHITHTQRENVAGPNIWEKEELSGQKLHARRRAPSDFNTSTSTLPATIEEDTSGQAPSSRPTLLPRHTATPFTGVRRLLKTGRTLDVSQHTRTPPPRPPRSPVDTNEFSVNNPPVRTVGNHFYQLNDVANANTSDRPRTSGGVLCARPISPTTVADEVHVPLQNPSKRSSGASRLTPISVTEASLNDNEPAWPLASPTIAFYDYAQLEQPVVDDDKMHIETSNRPSLRGSHSVPMLRATTGALHASRTNFETESSHDVGCDSWEDDIDYCYEHEVEADCDYRWERSSLDVGRNGSVIPYRQALNLDEVLSCHTSTGTDYRSPDILSASRFEVPALSPTSQLSGLQDVEVVTPAFANLAKFDCLSPKHKTNLPPMLKLSNRSSQASSFKESHGFDLSPSLLVPSDYQEEMLAAAKKAHDETNGTIVAKCNGAGDSMLEELTSSKSKLQQRVSTATTESNYSTHSISTTGERHVSTNSNWTALTRHTASSTSLTKMSGPWIDSSEPNPEISIHTTTIGENFGTEHDIVPELNVVATNLCMKKSLHKSHASESQVPGSSYHSEYQALGRPYRQRARTSSLTSPVPPPVGQYGLYPKVQKSTSDSARNSLIIIQESGVPCAN